MTTDLPKGTVRRCTLALLRPYRKQVAVAAAGIVGATFVTIAGPWLVRYAVDNGIEKHDLSVVNKVALLYLCLVIVRPLFERAIVLGAARAGERFLGDLRVAAFEKLQRLSLPFFEEEKAGVLVSRLTADVQTLTTFTRTVLIEVIGSVMLLVVTFVVLLVLSPLLTAFTLVAVPPLVVAIIRYQKRSRPAFLALRDRVADTMTALQEGLSGIRVVQSFGREHERYAVYRLRSDGLVAQWRRVSLVNIGFYPVISLAQAASAATVIAAGGVLHSRGDVSTGTVVAFALYLSSLFDPIARLGDWFSEFQSGRAALTKIVGLLETPETVGDPELPLPLPGEGDLVGRDVEFSYGESSNVLEGVTLELEPGEHLALVGPTGAGKSTLAKLLTRHYDPNRGEVAFGGVDLRETAHASLRRKIVFVPQEGHLFSGSIADNIRLGRPGASDGEVADALGRIGAYDRFAALPEGLQTDVRTRGVRLSSGERQLVGLARVALADPEVIVLDEATSNLDPQTESAVERALAAVADGRTMITIAHRLSTAERADRVAVLDQGRVVEIASHDELLQRESHYARLWASWQAGVAEAVIPGDRREPREPVLDGDEAGHAHRPPQPPPGEY
jgi:ATP-binding cassette subfamily B protein